MTLKAQRSTPMQRSALKRSSTSKLKRSRLAPVSATGRRFAVKQAKEYAIVNGRSGGECEVKELVRVQARPIRRAWARCDADAIERHHTKKPRRTFYQARWLLHVCRYHHEYFEPGYRGERLVPVYPGQGRGECKIVKGKVSGGERTMRSMPKPCILGMLLAAAPSTVALAPPSARPES